MLFTKKYRGHKTKFSIGGVEIGGKNIVVIAGPCSISEEKKLDSTAKDIKTMGIKIIRGGAYKPRTSPYAFQGLQENGLKLLAKVAKKYGLLTISEALSAEQVSLVEKYCDIIQIGARHMFSSPILKAAGKAKKPVLLKRAMNATYREWLYAAEYILKEGNSRVILCERGIISFGKETRNVLDIMAIDYIKRKTHLPIFVDPSHATGKREMVYSACLAAIAAGADGLLIEASHFPNQELSDARQTISTPTLERIIRKGRLVAKAINRNLI
jgi:3-deoxy-7-phosphoheptulonate synthase